MHRSQADRDQGVCAVEGSLVTANRSTHFKIALVAMLAAAAVIWIASCAQVDAGADPDKRRLGVKVDALRVALVR
jgi:hypothetical protein